MEIKIIIQTQDKKMCFNCVTIGGCNCDMSHHWFALKNIIISFEPFDIIAGTCTWKGDLITIYFCVADNTCYHKLTKTLLPGYLLLSSWVNWILEAESPRWIVLVLCCMMWTALWMCWTRERRRRVFRSADSVPSSLAK